MHLAQLLHQVDLVLHPACRVDNHDVLASGPGALHGVSGDSGGVPAPLAADTADPEVLGVGGQLVDGARAEGIRGGQNHRVALLGEPVG